MEDKILKLLGGKDYVPANVPELLRGLRMAPNQQQKLQKSLKALTRSGRIARIKGNRYILPQEADLIPGRIQITRRGRGFLLPDDPHLAEIAIPTSATGTALHDDHVLVRRDVGTLSGKGKSGESGAVVRVLERRRKSIVGTLKRSKQFLYVIPDDPRLPHDVYVPPPTDVGRPARMGDKVVVELGEWESRHTNPEGKITEVLGPPTAEGVDMLAVLRHYDLPLKFPAKVLREAKRFGAEISPKDIEGRVDCRRDQVITIDPADAKDFDDAFSLKRTNSKRWKLCVHIADVSHYVRPGSVLDEEARRRGNSTYLVDRVIPMLPEVLSNELCSLKPGVDRLSKCVEFLIDDDGKVHRARPYAAVIHSQRRYSYEEALEVLESKGKGKDDIEAMLKHAGRLAQRLRRRRFKAGALELDFPETKIRLDSRGRVKRIEKVENDSSHQLIEEFMLLANEAVASRLNKMKRASLHRVHEKPDPVRLQEYREVVQSHHIPCGNLENPAEVQRLLKRLGGLAMGEALKIGFLKSMSRARYAEASLGHYGLAKANYTHFTSPIRRYADLVVHRTLFEKAKLTRFDLGRLGQRLSTAERNSADAERDSKNVKLFAYLAGQLKSKQRPPYAAMVTDIRNFGFFVDVTDLGMSGLVPLSLLDDDFYEFDSVRLQIRGRRSHRLIRLGDQVSVQVAKVDTFKKQVDFSLVLPRKKKSSQKKRRKGEKRVGGQSKKNQAGVCAAKSAAKRGRHEKRGERKPARKRRRKAGTPKRGRAS